MTTTSTQPQSEPAKAKSVQPPPAPRVEPEPRRPSAVGRFFSRLMMLAVAVAVSFGAGYYVMDQEARLHRQAFQQEQAAAQERIAALEEQLRQMQLSRMQENSVAVDLTDVFAPIKAAVSRLAEAQMTLVAQQISAEVARRVESDVQNLNTSAPLAAIAETAAAAIAPASAAPPLTEAADEASPEPAADEAPGEPPGTAAAEPEPVEPGSGQAAPDGGPATPGDGAATAQQPAAELSGQALGRGFTPDERLPGRLPEWLLRLADTVDSARARLDTATSPAPAAIDPEGPAPLSLGRRALGG